MPLKLCLINPCSVCNKATELCDFTMDNALDACVITETWLKGDERDEVILAELKPPGYHVKHVPRKGRGGGIAVMHRDSILSVPNTSNSYQSFECLECVMQTTPPVRLVTIYRPPPSKTNGNSFRTFMEEITAYFELLVISTGILLVLGDFNLHIDKPADKEGAEFISLVESLGMTQHVTGATHRVGTRWIWLLTRNMDNIVPRVAVEDKCLSDHYPCSVCYPYTALCLKHSDTPADNVISLYNSVLSSIVDSHAPKKTRRVPARSQPDWYTALIREAKQQRRQCERLWRKTRLTVHRDMFIEAKRKVNIMIAEAKSSHFHNIISENSGDSKKLFSVVSNLLASVKPSICFKDSRKVVSSRLTSYLEHNGLQETHQYAYRKHHSTETALVRIQNDVMVALGGQKACLMVLLDLSAAFDTVDHLQLLTTLSDLGVKSTALKWMTSYLSDRQQIVCLGKDSSDPQTLECGVPQGSVLGPVLFTVYTSSLGQLLRSQDMDYHFYADDSSLYLMFHPNDITITVHRLEKCITSVRQWMSHKCLKINDSKTEVLLISSKHLARKIECPSSLLVTIRWSLVSGKEHRCHNGQHASMEDHITSVCRSAQYHLYNIGRIRKYLTREATEQLIHAFITSKLDYCNALLCGLPVKQIKRLQRLQNIAARIVTLTKTSSHITQYCMNFMAASITRIIQSPSSCVQVPEQHGTSIPARSDPSLSANKSPTFFWS
ncbi:hypothetical protein BSL78_13780 [Apostichopus japonicus]|uniref:Reverse transcriptase domain-containing protein n=1 Tax=Stichopus japonicus TaxID=307972 RepID=A0A2G8KN05_STIJA|nr:hypothetical protein BSL78_13780 [Apostichopus japonicus]